MTDDAASALKGFGCVYLKVKDFTVRSPYGNGAQVENKPIIEDSEQQGLCYLFSYIFSLVAIRLLKYKTQFQREEH